MSLRRSGIKKWDTIMSSPYEPLFHLLNAMLSYIHAIFHLNFTLLRIRKRTRTQEKKISSKFKLPSSFMCPLFYFFHFIWMTMAEQHEKAFSSLTNLKRWKSMRDQRHASIIINISIHRWATFKQKKKEKSCNGTRRMN